MTLNPYSLVTDTFGRLVRDQHQDKHTDNHAFPVSSELALKILKNLQKSRKLYIGGEVAAFA